MTMPHERSRALVWAGGLLIEIARDPMLPWHLRRSAVVIARHFPTIEQVESMAVTTSADDLAPPSMHPSWARDCKLGPLTYGTHLALPDDEQQVGLEEIGLLLARAEAVSADTTLAIRWLSKPLQTFDGKTPMELVAEGRTQDIVAYLDTIENGFLG